MTLHAHQARSWLIYIALRVDQAVIVLSHPAVTRVSATSATAACTTHSQGVCVCLDKRICIYVCMFACKSVSQQQKSVLPEDKEEQKNDEDREGGERQKVTCMHCDYQVVRK